MKIAEVPEAWSETPEAWWEHVARCPSCSQRYDNPADPDAAARALYNRDVGHKGAGWQYAEEAVREFYRWRAVGVPEAAEGQT